MKHIREKNTILIIVMKAFQAPTCIASIVTCTRKVIDNIRHIKSYSQRYFCSYTYRQYINYAGNVKRQVPFFSYKAKAIVDIYYDKTSLFIVHNVGVEGRTRL